MVSEKCWGGGGGVGRRGGSEGTPIKQKLFLPLARPLPGTRNMTADFSACGLSCLDSSKMEVTDRPT